VLVLPFTKDEAYAAVAAYMASEWPSNLTDTSITAAEASIKGTNRDTFFQKISHCQQIVIFVEAG
jgi:hypothetical protein